MKIGITQLCLGGLSLQQCLDFCKDAGYEAIELKFGPGGDPDMGGSADDIRAVRRACDDAGIEIASILAWGDDRGSILSPDEAERQKMCDTIARGLEIAEILGVDAILLHPGALAEAARYDLAYDWALEALRKMAPVAEKHKVTIAVENVWNKFLLSPTEMRDFVDAVGSKYVGTYLDVGNMILYGYPQHWIEVLEHRMRKVHFKDFSRGQGFKFVPLQEGDVNWSAVMEAFRKVGFDGCVVSEVGGSLDDHRETARRMKEIIKL